jgi:hypothetical protein
VQLLQDAIRLHSTGERKHAIHYLWRLRGLAVAANVDFEKAYFDTWQEVSRRNKACAS